MSDFQPDTNTNSPVAFCQNCGKSLDNDTIRKVGSAVYCEPCLAAKISGPPPADPARPYGNVFVGGSAPGSTSGSAGPQPPFSPSTPNPGLAALLGLIPGVGAMYNEQYAKGVVHLIIFALLVSFSHVTGIFILFVFGWIAYMAIEAHHTAQARRDGTPLPNPFGFNDIGERMGFGSAWPGADPAATARDAVNTAAQHINAAAAGFQRPPIVTPPPAGSPWAPPANPAQNPYSQPTSYPNPGPQPTYPYTDIPYTPVSTAIPPYAPPYIPPVPTPGRVPVGAIVLIGLGTFFLLSTIGVFHEVPGEALFGFVLIAIGAWAFFRRMTETGLTLANDGSSGYQFRLFRALKGSIWLGTLGILWLFDAFRILRFSDTWPALIILAGVMMILSRTLYASAAAHVFYAGAPSQSASSIEVGPTESAPPTDTHEGGN